MSAVDFTEWAAPDLTLTFTLPTGGERTFAVRPPTVGNMTKVLALAARGEVELGMVPGVVLPPAIREVLDSIGTDEHPALGDTFAEMRDADLADATINRIAYYAIFYWARGKRYADALAELLWSPRETEQDDTASGDAARKG